MMIVENIHLNKLSIKNAFQKLLDKITSNKSSDSLKLNFDCFKDDLNLAISILMIEVSKSDDEFSSEEKDKIISLLEHHFSLNQEQISVLIELAEEEQ